VQYRQLSVWSVYSNFTYFLAQTIFSEGTEGVHNTSGNSGGVGGGYFCVQTMEIPGGGGLTGNSLCGGGWTFSGTTHSQGEIKFKYF